MPTDCWPHVHLYAEMTHNPASLGVTWGRHIPQPFSLTMYWHWSHTLVQNSSPTGEQISAELHSTNSKHNLCVCMCVQACVRAVTLHLNIECGMSTLSFFFRLDSPSIQFLIYYKEIILWLINVYLDNIFCYIYNLN